MRNSYLVCSLRACHMWLTRNHIFIREIWGKFTSFIFWNFEITREISKFQKSELGKFIPNFPLKHVITSTNWNVNLLCLRADAHSEPCQASQVEIFFEKTVNDFQSFETFQEIFHPGFMVSECASSASLEGF